MTVADEKDKLAPQLEEVRWRNRQLEKDVQQLQDTSSGQEQVCCSQNKVHHIHTPIVSWLLGLCRDHLTRFTVDLFPAVAGVLPSRLRALYMGQTLFKSAPKLTG